MEVLGRKYLTGFLVEESYGGRLQWCGKRHYIQRIKTEVIKIEWIPAEVYGSGTSSLSAQDRTKVELFEIMCLRSIYTIRRVDRERNSVIRESWVYWKNWEERVEMARACGKNGKGKIGQEKKGGWSERFTGEERVNRVETSFCFSF